MRNAQLKLTNFDSTDIITASTPSVLPTFTLSNFFDGNLGNGTVTNDLTNVSWVNDGDHGTLVKWLNEALGYTDPKDYKVGNPDSSFNADSGYSFHIPGQIDSADGNGNDALKELFNITFKWVAEKNCFEKYQQ